MSFLISSIEVEDYNKWRTVFDEGEQSRRQHGMNGGRVYQDVANPNLVTVIVEGGLSGMQTYRDSQEIKDSMSQAGVLGPPRISFVEDVT